MIQTIAPVLFPPILVATDGSPSAELALVLGQSIAQLLGQSTREDSVTLTILNVQPRLAKEKAVKNRSIQEKANSPADHSADERSSESSAYEPLADDLTGLTPVEHLGNAVGAISTPIQVRRGRAITEILNYAREIKAGLIAVGYRSGSGGVRELLLGSVSTAIARYAPCSVLVARRSTNSSTDHSLTDHSLTNHSLTNPILRHVLLVVQEGAATQHAIATVRQLADAGIQHVTLLTIQPTLNAGYLMGPIASHTPNWQLNQSLRTVQKEEAEAMLNQAKAALSLPKLEVQTRIQKGDPGPIICQIAQELQVDLVVVGTAMARRSLPSPLQAMHLVSRKPSPPARPVLRNTRLSITEDYIIHYAPCPVLLCRGG
jgi:nucleotide-binding universal stress UspA family protein